MSKKQPFKPPTIVLKELCATPRAAVSLVTKCSRAIILSHFDTATNLRKGKSRSPILGASQRFLSSRKEEEGVSQDDWNVYKELWRRLSHNAKLEEDSEFLNILAMRTPNGKYSDSRPGVFSITDTLLGEAIPRMVLTDLYRFDLCLRHCLKDSPEFIAYAQEWIDRFDKVTFATQGRSELLNLVSQEESPHEPEWAKGLVEGLEFLAILQFSRENLRGYKIRFKADPAFVLTNLFGRSTGVEGLDYLLFGGLWVPGGIPSNDNLSIVISGSPGMGKSTLALGMAIQAAARGGLCLFFRLEPDEGLIPRQIAQYHRMLRPFFRIVSNGTKHAPTLNPTVGQDLAFSHGSMVIEDIVTAPIEEIQSTVIRLARDQDLSHFPERMVVFDSISAAQGYGQNSDTWRKFLFETTKVLRALGYVVVYLVERESGDLVDFEDFVADVSIRLARRELLDCPYPFRTLEIVKSRSQASHRGDHVYSIQAEAGMKVFPSSPAVMSARGRREARIRYQENKLVDPGVRYFASYLGGDGMTTDTPEGEVRWWRKGSVTALLGPRGTLKSSFARSFSGMLDKDSGTVSCALSLNFADEFQSYRNDLQRDKQRPTAFGVRYDIPLPGQRGRDGLGATLSYVLFRSGYLASGQALQTVRDLIVEKRKCQTPIRRAVISDAANIAPDFPALKSDPAFIPALCDLLTSEGITTVIVYSKPELEGDDHVIDQIRSVSENIIKFEPINYGSREYTAIGVQRSADGSHDRGVYELRESLGSPSLRGLEVHPTFDLVVGLQTGKPKAASVKILLDAGTGLQRRYHDNMVKFYAGLRIYDIQVLDHAVAFSRQGSVQHITSAERGLWIVQIDPHELLNEDAAGNRQGLLCDLSLLHPKIKDLQEELLYAPTTKVGRHGKNDRSKSQLLSIPYYLNPSVLVVQKEFREFARTSRWPTIGEGQGDYSWQDLTQAALAFRDTDPDRWKDYAMWGNDFGQSETLNCLYLEIVASLSKVIEKTEAFPDWFALQEDRSSLVNAVITLRKLVKNSSRTNTAITSETQREWNTANTLQSRSVSAGSPQSYKTQKAIMWRLWYSAFRQMAADMLEGNSLVNPKLALLRLPGGVWTNGDSHLAILEGSVGMRQGIEVILDRFVNRSTAMNLMTQGVGLPPFKDFYLETGKFPVSDVGADWFAPYVISERVIHRSALKNYRNVAPILRTFLGSFLGLETDDEREAARWIERGLSSMHGMIKRMALNEPN